MFMVESDDVTPSGEVHDGVVVEVGANDDVRHHLAADSSGSDASRRVRTPNPIAA